MTLRSGSAPPTAGGGRGTDPRVGERPCTHARAACRQPVLNDAAPLERALGGHKPLFFGAFARVGKALGHPTRLELLDLLAQAPRTVDALAHACGASVASTSQHLQTLWRAGLVTREKQGLHVRYQLGSDDVVELYASLRRVAASCGPPPAC